MLIVLVRKIKLNSKKIIGDPRIFSLQERIFNTVSIIAFITMCFEVPFNLAIGLIVPGCLCLFGVFFAVYIYYLSRFKRKSSLGIKLFCIVCNVAFSINYFYNSGVYGPNLLLFSLVFLMIIAVIPRKDFKFWIPTNIVLVFMILALEYFYPNTVSYTYNSNVSKVLDFGITYFVVVILTYFTISYIRENYDYERSSVIDKNVAIKAQNFKILEQNTELERLNSEKDKLFSIVTHDVRSPLSSIQSYLEILTDHDLDWNERLHLERQLLQITRDTSDMLTNVLSWSKTQMEGVHVDLMLLDIKDALENRLGIERNIAYKKGLGLDVFCEEGLMVFVDQNMFQLIMRNLVSNAIKFTPTGGHVVITASRQGDRCCIMVKDNGLGVDKLRQEQLFKFKASSTYGTNNEKGVGLGLILCKEYAELQGGKIWYEPNEGNGSIFLLSFALA